MKRKGTRGGKRKGAGRKSGSVRPERRVQRARDYALDIAEILDQLERKGSKWAYNEAVERAYRHAYVEDYSNRPDLYRVSDDGEIDILDDKHFASFRQAQEKKRERGKADSGLPQDPTAFAVAVHEAHFKEVIEFLREEGELKLEPSEALELLWQAWPALGRQRKRLINRRP